MKKLSNNEEEQEVNRAMEGKTISKVDAECYNSIDIYFTDGTRITINSVYIQHQVKVPGLEYLGE